MKTAVKYVLPVLSVIYFQSIFGDNLKKFYFRKKCFNFFQLNDTHKVIDIYNCDDKSDNNNATKVMTDTATDLPRSSNFTHIEIARKIPINIPSNIPSNISSNITSNTTSNMTRNITRNITSNVTKNITSNSTSNISRNMTSKRTSHHYYMENDEQPEILKQDFYWKQHYHSDPFKDFYQMFYKFLGLIS